jgi:hypothetical protein
MPKKAKRGRPPMPPDMRRVESLYLKLTPAERAEIDAAAKGKSVTIWAREVVLRAARRINDNLKSD